MKLKPTSTQKEARINTKTECQLQNQDSHTTNHHKYRQYHLKAKKVTKHNNSWDNNTKPDKNTQYETKPTERKHNIHRMIKTKNTKK